MTTFLIILGLIALLVWGILHDRANDRKYKTEQLAKNEAFLKEENAKPRCRLVAENQRGETVRSAIFEPRINDDFWINGPYYLRYTSRCLAEEELERTVKRQAMETEDSSVVLFCDLRKVSIEEVKT